MSKRAIKLPLISKKIKHYQKQVSPAIRGCHEQSLLGKREQLTPQDKFHPRAPRKSISVILLLLVILLVVLPLVLQPAADFTGADNLAQEAISQLDPEYMPWFNNIWRPPSAEVESLLFALQAALGGGFVGYYLGFARGRRAQRGDHHAVD